jgi:hypothetical protein
MIFRIYQKLIKLNFNEINIFYRVLGVVSVNYFLLKFDSEFVYNKYIYII